jgi:heme/copper-type cytochrome/quinol oxidase subunit 2
MSATSKWIAFVNFSEAFMYYVIMPAVVIGLMVVFIPIGIIALIVWLILVYRRRAGGAARKARDQELLKG